MNISYVVNVLFKYFHIYIWNWFKNILGKNVFKNSEKCPKLDEDKKCPIDEYQVWINDDNEDEWFPN